MEELPKLLLMKRNKIIFIIGFFVIAFVVINITFNVLCQSSQDNAVVNAVSSVLSSPKPVQSPAYPDSLSWEPFLQKLVNLFAKACPR